MVTPHYTSTTPPFVFRRRTESKGGKREVGVGVPLSRECMRVEEGAREGEVPRSSRSPEGRGTMELRGKVGPCDGPSER